MVYVLRNPWGNMNGQPSKEWTGDWLDVLKELKFLEIMESS